MTRGVVLFVLVRVFAQRRKNTSKAKTEKTNSKAHPLKSAEDAAPPS
jgi:hypothetical protein